ncbi:phage protein [Brevibacillus sp. SIMBA_040]|uniref:phage protein n=1 Tax=unclassified Brevibacillus TaxID=2684853 RepID=UPI0039798961
MAENIKNLAVYEAQVQGVDLNIVLATIEAETNFTNKTGDSGNALGPGQVWPKWHTDSFKYAANRSNKTWPSTLQEQTRLVLSDDALATAAAVRVIGRTWKAAKGDFREFSLIYVGKKIPDWDYERRLKIYQKYAGGGAGGSWSPSTSVPNSNATGGNGSGGQSANLINDITLPSTNYGIVAKSQKIGNVLYGRRYRVLVSNGKGTALDVSDLRCVFDIKKTLTPQPNFSTVTIYNLNTETENQVINEGDTVIVEAGYEGEQYGLIFRGNVIQAIRGKEDGVDYKLILNSVDGDRFLNNGMVALSVVKGQTARSQIGIVTSQAKVPTQQGTISNYLQPAALTRGKVFFGLGKDYLRQIAQSNAATFYLEDGKVNIITAQDYPPNEIVDLSPESGLIGTPMQTDFGVSFKCLLNPRLKINSLVRIDNSQIQAQTFQFGQIQRGLDAAGIYRIIGIRQNGDTRGDAWYTECDTVSQAGGVIPGLMPSGGANIWR